MKRTYINKTKSPEEIMREVSELNNYDLDKIKGLIKELEIITENKVIGDQLLRNLDNIYKDIGILKDRVVETYIRLLKQGYEIS
jgi:adenylate cyclase class IV